MSAGPADNSPKAREAKQWVRDIQAIASTADPIAFQNIFDYFAPRVKAITIKSGIAPETAEEIAQETMIIVWRKAAQYKPAMASVSTWIFTIARNKKIDRLRRDSRPLPDVNDPSFSFGTAENPEEDIWHAMNSEKVSTALEKLSEPQREVLTMAFLEENAHAAISQKLDIPLGTVKSRIRLGLQKLKTHLADQRGDFL